MIDLRSLQRRHAEWAARNFPSHEPWEPLMGACEELGELCHAHLKAHQKIRGTEAEHRAAARDAVGDVVVYLTQYCSDVGFDLEEIIEETFDHVHRRDWVADPLQGGDHA